MKKLLIFFLTVGLAGDLLAQQPANEFFVLHNSIRGDSVYRTFDAQVALIQSIGYDGVEINQVDSFEGMKAALDKHRFKGSYFYVKVNGEAPFFDPRTEACIRALKGSGTIVAPYVLADAKRFLPSSGGADTTVVRLMRQLADWAQASDLQIALYPHYGFYVERHDHALRLVRTINRPNVGLTFNLCHWLATVPRPNRADWQNQLRAMRPYLKMITVSGANDVDIPAKSVNPNALWDQYILPLGTGSFDTFELLRFVVNDLSFKGPIGVQCYHLAGDKPTRLRNTMAVWKTNRQRLQPANPSSQK